MAHRSGVMGSAWCCIFFFIPGKAKSKERIHVFRYLFAHLRRNFVGKDIGIEIYSIRVQKNCLYISTSSLNGIISTQESAEGLKVPEMKAQRQGMCVWKRSPWLFPLQETNANTECPVKTENIVAPSLYVLQRGFEWFQFERGYNETSFTRAWLLNVPLVVSLVNILCYRKQNNRKFSTLTPYPFCSVYTTVLPAILKLTVSLYRWNIFLIQPLPCW